VDVRLAPYLQRLPMYLPTYLYYSTYLPQEGMSHTQLGVVNDQGTLPGCPTPQLEDPFLGG
jgi:hypothetical protein